MRNPNTSSVGVSDTRELIQQIIDKLPEQWQLSDEENIHIIMSGVHLDALCNVFLDFLNEKK